MEDGFAFFRAPHDDAVVRRVGLRRVAVYTSIVQAAETMSPSGVRGHVISGQSWFSMYYECQCMFAHLFFPHFQPRAQAVGEGVCSFPPAVT